LLNSVTFDPPFKLWKNDLFPELAAELAETDLFFEPRSDKERFLPEVGAVLFRAVVVRGVYAGGGLTEGILRDYCFGVSWMRWKRVQKKRSREFNQPQEEKNKVYPRPRTRDAGRERRSESINELVELNRLTYIFRVLLYKAPREVNVVCPGTNNTHLPQKLRSAGCQLLETQ